MRIAIAILFACLVSRTAGATCNGDPDANPCGTGCIPSTQKCCIDEAAQQWICDAAATCGNSVGECMGCAHHLQCIGCNSEFKCEGGQICSSGYCVVPCAS